MKLGLFIAFAVVLLADQCHGLHYKNREYYGGSPAKGEQTAFTVPAILVVLLPTMTEECDINSCSRVVRSIQENDMNNRNYDDLAENFVVGGCTGIFPGGGWDYISPMSQKDTVPSVNIGVVGRFTDSRVQPNVAKTVKALILDGVTKGKVDSNFKIKFSNQNGECPTPFMETMKELMPEYFDFTAEIYAN